MMWHNDTTWQEVDCCIQNNVQHVLCSHRELFYRFFLILLPYCHDASLNLISCFFSAASSNAALVNAANDEFAQTCGINACATNDDCLNGGTCDAGTCINCNPGFNGDRCQNGSINPPQFHCSSNIYRHSMCAIVLNIYI